MSKPTIEEMLDAKDVLSEQITDLVNNFVDEYSVHDIELHTVDERIIGNKRWYVMINVQY